MHRIFYLVFPKNLWKMLNSDFRVTDFIMFLDLALGKKVHHLMLVS